MANPERRTFPGYEVIVLDTEDHVEVWLDTEAGDFDGICLASETTRPAAIADATTALRLALAAVESLAPPGTKEHARCPGS